MSERRTTNEAAGGSADGKVGRAVFLGPQRHLPAVRPAVDGLCGSDSAPVALISAGWEEREAEDGEFREHMRRPLLNLEIWGRVERIFERDPELLEAMRQRHDALRRAQELYRLRLGPLVSAARALLQADDEPGMIEPERAGAIAMLQSLDREHTERVATIHAGFDARWRPQERPAVQEHRREVGELLAGAGCLCIAGGHVGVLLHRLRLFGLRELWGNRPIVAWAAGAMVLSERVVLFHRERGQVDADTEVLEAGFGLVSGIVPLPNARRRLDLGDVVSLQLLARRFQPDRCVLLDDGKRTDWDGRSWHPQKGTRFLSIDGVPVESGG